MPRRPLAVLLAALGLALAGCASHPTRSTPPAPSTSTTAPSTSTTGTAASTTTAAPDPVLLIAGDIADCGLPGSRLTAEVVAAHPDAVVAAAGDLAYDRGTPSEFASCYGPTWGRFKDRTHPAPGNHEYGTGVATGYFGYFGAAAGPAGKGWYSYDVGGWHIVALNSNCGTVGCGPTSEQGRWLAADLAAHRTTCALAYWHHPRWSSGMHGSQAQVDPLWRAVASGGVDVVVNGHDHDYERFAAIDGVREFVVGTGGATRYPIGSGIAGSEARDSGAFGVLELTLHATSYDWRFLPAAGTAFTDAGSGTCK
jgi:hypothetical protein